MKNLVHINLSSLKFQQTYIIISNCCLNLIIITLDEVHMIMKGMVIIYYGKLLFSWH